MQKVDVFADYNKIKQLADMKGISIHKLEFDAGLQNGAVRRWAEKNPPKPSATSIINVARVLGVDHKKLLIFVARKED